MTFPWHDNDGAAIAALTKLWAMGLSCSKIAEQLGPTCTKNAVIGMAHRQKLPMRTMRQNPLAQRKAAKGGKRALVIGVGRRVRKALAKVRKPASVAPNPVYTPTLKAEAGSVGAVAPTPVRPPGGAQHASLLDHTGCKWPLGDPREPGFAFCNADKREGSPYCPTHHAWAYRTADAVTKKSVMPHAGRVGVPV